jgi:hypothetical protein
VTAGVSAQEASDSSVGRGSDASHPQIAEHYARKRPGSGVRACAIACLPSCADAAAKSLEWNRSWLCSGANEAECLSSQHTKQNLRDQSSAKPRSKPSLPRERFSPLAACCLTACSRAVIQREEPAGPSASGDLRSAFFASVNPTHFSLQYLQRSFPYGFRMKWRP